MLAASRRRSEHFLDRVTINVSQLWRNPEQWERLAPRSSPRLAETGTVRAWSAGCSYGAEAYTLAAICRRGCAPAAGVEILGTDIDTRMVERAREGRFTPTTPAARTAGASSSSGSTAPATAGEARPRSCA